MNVKKCNKCKRVLPINQFGMATWKGRLGRRSRCNSCRAAEARVYHATHPLTLKQKVNLRLAQERWRKSEKGRKSEAKFRCSPKRRIWLRAWSHSKGGKKSLKLANERLRYKKRKWIQQKKIQDGCVDCGYKKNPVALDFDHVKGRKKFNLSQTMGRSLIEIQRELAKCVVRCANCHRIKTVKIKEHVAKKWRRKK